MYFRIKCVQTVYNFCVPLTSPWCWPWMCVIVIQAWALSSHYYNLSTIWTASGESQDVVDLSFLIVLMLPGIQSSAEGHVLQSEIRRWFQRAESQSGRKVRSYTLKRQNEKTLNLIHLDQICMIWFCFRKIFEKFNQCITWSRLKHSFF